MIDITFIQPDGSQKTVAAKAGHTIMETAQAHGIDGVIAECGGSMACATCHVFLDDIALTAAGPASDSEDDMLEFAATPRADNSRLSCQVTVTDALNGAQITIPETQF
ncbi:2Fe-2S iron-sulfur cluster-binding protein [Tropicibacter naphthalenivorans]|uniref:Rhodocoxin n=1 Tax=Tropicibacter naphthalenivorans TaxID=441103 RepID=A0A0P1GZT2_9RHOB|nr:2Fe-2S iron-sulfur cluster-binding protein [Tropicibacter naphthalenivorans]CUH80627.1 Rhodocoxin [Tropicibacter naphthalenivorans]SMC89100.1 ferredoxin, 2Fe-2S [Tropicibacter naphthalenivorans]